MQFLNRIKSSLKTGIIIAGIVSFFAGCSNNTSPVSPAAEPGNEIRFLKIAEVAPHLAKRISTTKLITRKKGGEIRLQYKAADKEKPLKIEVRLKVKANSISRDATFNRGIEGSCDLVGDFSVDCEPHGLVFSEPALLNIEVEHANLPVIDASMLDVVYVNQETGTWDLMPYKELKIDLKKGKLELKDAKIPHFSRYAIAHSR